ncbi:helix-turn-helix domain-containing protein [Intrasporangium calvum]|uniref:helix-turn-helix domain-containing protein n=1 Tax=Intrasporangium calvum TaxID=53358 RepID=UPI000DF6034A|nr:helix-turn-helix transcriptional regulator [Intrasporangium calvum]AXG12144.1 XRE family transcriptional regulator [Intrasporangium calvum]
MTEDHTALQAFGQRVRSVRGASGLSQESMAHRCGLHRTYYSAIERGERNVSLLNLLKLARGLSVDPGQLVAGLA